MTLGHLTAGECATVVGIQAENALQGRLMGMGLRVGARVRVLHVTGRWRRVYRLATGHTRLALGHVLANSVLVELD